METLMATPRQQIEARVDAAISAGKLAQAERQEAIEFLTKSPGRTEFFAQELAGGKYFTERAMKEAEDRRARQQELEQERQKIQAERTRLEIWSRDARAELDRARQIEQDREQLIRENAALRQVARDYNIKDEEVVVPQPKPQVPVEERIQPTHDGRLRDMATGKFVSEEQASQALQNIIAMTSKAMAVQAEHQRLFGAPLEDSLIEEAIAAGQTDVRQYWETKYNVSARKAQLAEDQRNQEIAKIREEERQKILGEMAVDPSKFVGTPQPWQSPSPLADAYMHSRAAENNPVGDLAPEKRSMLQQSRERVGNASAKFNALFNPDGSVRQGAKAPQSYYQNMADQDNP
jgi:hypothetical protein